MRLALTTCVLLALVAPVCVPSEDDTFAPVLPDGVGDVSGWTVVSGDFETATERGHYRLYVNPARAAMYQLMRYRVEVLAPVEAAAQRRGDAERVVFVRRPGVREPVACWERREPGSTTEWRQLVPGSVEYLVEMGVLMHVLAVHRAALASRAP
jgi:hypothetical protein